jgi:hypothetical protein
MARKDPRIEAAEDELIDCMRMLRRLPDRERGWLYHSTLRWPAMVGEQSDYPDEVRPRASLSRWELARVEAMFDGAGCIIGRAVAVRDMRLVETVVKIKAAGASSGFGWDDVWKALRGMLATGARGSDDALVLRKVTSDAMRVRYGRALERIAAVMGAALDERLAARSGGDAGVQTSSAHPA